MPKERLLPQNKEAEQGVLGSLLIDPDAISLIADFLSPEDLYYDSHKTIYGILMQLYASNTPADMITVRDMLIQQQKLEEIGGLSVVTELINWVPTSANVMYYARIVSRTSLLRRLIHAGSDIVAQAYEDEEENAANTLEQAEQRIFEVGQQFSNSLVTSSHIRDIVTAYMARLDLVHSDRGMVVGVPTGFSDLDRMLGGLQKSDLLILAGRPGMGKSAAALSIAYHAAKIEKRKIGIFSLEMSKEQLIQRLVAMDSGIDSQRLRTGWIEDDEWERLIPSMNAMSNLEIWIDDTANISTIQMRSKARRWALEHEIDLLIVDYLQLMEASTSNGKKIENRTQEVGIISRSLKGLARELNIPVLALAQLSRAVENRASKIPQLSDLRESGSIENDADIVMFIYRDDAYNPESERKNTADIIIAKHRNGPVGEVSLAFEKRQTRFRDLIVGPPEEVEEIDEDIVYGDEDDV